MSALERAIEGAKARNARVVLPEMEDDRIAAAAETLRADGICEPVALGDNTEAYVAALVEARG